MRSRLALPLASLLLVPLAAHGDGTQPAPAEAKRKLVGAWESRRKPDGYRQLKYIAPTHFIWVIYDVEKKDPVGTAGGTWTLRGDTYVEAFDFASEGWVHLRGKTIGLTSKVDGDRWTVQGTLDTGFKIDETWDRQKAAPATP